MPRQLLTLLLDPLFYFPDTAVEMPDLLHQHPQLQLHQGGFYRQYSLQGNFAAQRLLLQVDALGRQQIVDLRFQGRALFHQQIAGLQQMLQLALGLVFHPHLGQ